MSQWAVEVRSLSKRFGANRVLCDVGLQVPAGATYAFLGRNGAGKTTTIRILLGLLNADEGQASVLGLDPRRQAIDIRRQVGYLAEDQRMFGWMKVRQALDFVRPFYPTWDAALAADLAGQFELPMGTRVKHLSKGQGIRLGLLLAMAHRPGLVILDDPTLGLDPIMRKDFLRDVVGHLQSSGATVFFSSHLLYEIEPVADWVGILEGGRLIVQAPTEQLRQSVKQIILPADRAAALDRLPGVLDVQQHGRQVAAVVAGADEAVAALSAGGNQPVVNDLNLDEIFAAYAAGRRGPA
jgi:ABC-2 type transport system ATP-binding protein